jgi:hypothetical protein
MASRKEQKERLKAERLERERQAQSAVRRKKLVGYGVGGVLALALVVGLGILALGGLLSGDGGSESAASQGEYPEGSVPPVETADLEEAARAAGCKLEQPPEEGSEHISPPETVEYEANPPTSGNHYNVPAEDGAYTEAPPTEALVHTLEHGRIFIQFDSAAPESVKGDLKALYDEDPYHMIIAPNETDMPYEVAATAWTQTLGCPKMNDKVFDAIRAFRDEYRDQGPEFVP